MKAILKKIKSELKSEGKAIREIKNEIKDRMRYGTAGVLQVKLIDRKHDFRHRHIAYCELRGTPRHLIEQPRENNKPNEDKIRQIKIHWHSLIES